MSKNILPTKEEIAEELKQITIYPSGKKNQGSKPINGEEALKEESLGKTNGYRIAFGVIATVAAASLLRDPEVQPDPTALNQAIGTTGELLMLAGGIIGAMGKEKAQELGRDIQEAWNSGKEARKEFGDQLKTAFVNGVSNTRKEGKKVGKNLQSFTRRTISNLSKNKSSDLEATFEVYRPKQDGKEGVELSYIEFTKRNGRS